MATQLNCAAALASCATFKALTLCLRSKYTLNFGKSFENKQTNFFYLFFQKLFFWIIFSLCSEAHRCILMSFCCISFVICCGFLFVCFAALAPGFVCTHLLALSCCYLLWRCLLLFSRILLFSFRHFYYFSALIHFHHFYHKSHLPSFNNNIKINHKLSTAPRWEIDVLYCTTTIEEILLTV